MPSTPHGLMNTRICLAFVSKGEGWGMAPLLRALAALPELPSSASAPMWQHNSIVSSPDTVLAGSRHAHVYRHADQTHQIKIKKKISQCMWWWFTTLILELRRQKQVISEIEARLVSRVNARTTGATQRKSLEEKKKSQRPSINKR